VVRGNFIDGVKYAIQRYGMDPSRSLALVSGGPDSVALLRVMLELGFEPVVMHVNYDLRGEESDADAEFVEDLCTQFNLDCELRRVKVTGGNFQEEARNERYRLAHEILEAHDLSTILTGHTADDVAETVLLNLARGTGLRGLAGIPPVRELVARPLILQRRDEIIAYLEQLGQSYRTDDSNLRPKYARNRVRLEVMPILESLHPGAGGNIARTASMLRDDLEALESLAGRLIERRGGEIVVSLRSSESSPAILRHALRLAYGLLNQDSALDSTAIENILESVDSGEGTVVRDLAGGIVVAVRSGEEVAFYRREEVTWQVEELVVGAQRFEGWRIEVSEVGELDPEDAARSWVAYLDALGGPYRVRMPREGDRMRPLGLGGSKSVLKAMKDRRVPADLRLRNPVLVDSEGRIAWILSGELDEDHKVTPKTKKILRIEVQGIS
jgi:tRNA(Ile)-lysidine synthetase-like protein